MDRRSGAIHTAQRSDARAKRLRRAPTFWEKRLWAELRRVPIKDSHFRRQAPMGPYVVDFVCHPARLIVEADGPPHDLPEVQLRDAERDAWLRERGYTVLRVTNREMEKDMALVVRRIVTALGAGTPTPGPSPQGGGEV